MFYICVSNFFVEVLLLLPLGVFPNCAKFSFSSMFDCKSQALTPVASIGYPRLPFWITLNEERFPKMMRACITHFNLIEVLYDLKVTTNSFG